MLTPDESTPVYSYGGVFSGFGGIYHIWREHPHINQQGFINPGSTLAPIHLDLPLLISSWLCGKLWRETSPGRSCTRRRQGSKTFKGSGVPPLPNVIDTGLRNILLTFATDQRQLSFFVQGMSLVQFVSSSSWTGSSCDALDSSELFEARVERFGFYTLNLNGDTGPGVRFRRMFPGVSSRGSDSVPLCWKVSDAAVSFLPNWILGTFLGEPLAPNPE